MKPDEVVERIRKERATAILRTDVGKAAMPAMQAAIRGGFRIVEFTLTIPNVHELLREFSKQPGLVVGAGTILKKEEARDAVKNGARFLVSPVVDEEVIEEAHKLGVVIMPGTHTPTEMMRAYAAGAQMQKLFPAPAGGASYVKACLAPLPFLRIVPTNGVTAENAAEYLEAGAFAVGFVSPLFDPLDVQDERYDRIEARAHKLIRSVAQNKR